MNRVEIIQQVNNVSYIVTMYRIVRIEGTFYKIHCHRIGRNGRWYDSTYYEFNESAANRAYVKKCDECYRKTNWFNK